MATRKTAEELTRDLLTELVRDHFTGPVAESICRMVDELPSQTRLWNVRTAKAQFAKVLALVQTGYPQFVQREGDEEPVVLISLDTMYKLLDKRTVGLSFTEAMAPYMHRTSTNLTVPELGIQDRFTIPE